MVVRFFLSSVLCVLFVGDDATEGARGRVNCIIRNSSYEKKTEREREKRSEYYVVVLSLEVMFATLFARSSSSARCSASASNRVSSSSESA